LLVELAGVPVFVSIVSIKLSEIFVKRYTFSLAKISRRRKGAFENKK
jgi:hypothetical protein